MDFRFEEISGGLAGVVNVECRGSEAIFFCRDAEGRLREERRAFRPFALLSDPSSAEGFEGAERMEITPLAGDGVWKYMATFPDADSFRGFGAYAASARVPVWMWKNLRTQALAVCRVRCFAGMRFEALKRLAVSIGRDRKGAVTGIDLTVIDGGRRSLRLDAASCGGEHNLLKEFVRAVRESDCDVIEGYELCREILPALVGRAAKVRVEMALGRDGSLPESRPSRFALPEMQISYPRWEIYGRTVIDDWMLAAFYDAGKRVLEDDTLAAAAGHFGCLTEGDDSASAAALGDILLPSYFYQTPLLPMTLQEVVARGNGATVDALMACEYIVRGHALPAPEPPERFAGALVAVEATGVIADVWHCDVRSLYPSILLAAGEAPARDELNVFLETLARLRDMRLAAKDAARTAADPAERRLLDVLQKVFKITINSFYGYLGFAQGSFNDYRLAARVTGEGREILNRICDFLRERGAGIVEKDTDGVYFTPPEGVTDRGSFEASIQGILPEGIGIEIDAVYPMMFSYKSKNYALLLEDGRIELSGAALKSRGMEPYLRRFIMEAITLLLKGESRRLPGLRESYAEKIRSRAFPLSMLAKSEKLSDSPSGYRRKLEAGTGRRSAAYEVALRSSRGYRAGDSVAFYLTGDKPKPPVAEFSAELPEIEPPPEKRDENIPAYLRKLDEMYANFEEFIRP